MLLNRKIINKFLMLSLALITIGATSQAQKAKRVKPVWWFGESGAANFNYYRGTTQVLNNTTTVPTAFNYGKGLKPYASLLMEYRPNRFLGGMLNVAFDNRGGKFNTVMAPCNCPAELSTNLSYVTIEPSLRFAPLGSAFYLFAGPTISFNVAKTFTYKQDKQPDVRSNLGNIRKTVFSAQAGAGIDIPVSKKASAIQMTLSPFGSFQTNFGQTPRVGESWRIYTVRAGIALKFGKGHVAPAPVPVPPPVQVPLPAPVAVAPIIIVDGMQFSILAPVTVPAIREIKETFPIRNYIFFDEGSNAIPDRYVKLNNSEALNYVIADVVMPDPKDLEGRAHRQLTAYYNVLNILGNRMRANPTATVNLVGSSAGKGVEIGKAYAESVSRYLIDVFGIDASRIKTEGRNHPIYPSEKPGATKELVLLRQGDRRVDIISTNPALTKPLQLTIKFVDPTDRFITFKTASSEHEMLKSWTVEVKDENGVVQNFGPYTNGENSISGNTILGDHMEGKYAVVMTGQTTTGITIRRESSLHLIRNGKVYEEGLRFSILFDFNKSQSVAAYEKFLNEVVTPLVPNYSTVVIHGHTDIIGIDAYNLKLSKARAMQTQNILKRTLAKAGKKGIQFEAHGYGEDINAAPFDNKTPEERFYNRTVIIDIAPIK